MPVQRFPACNQTQMSFKKATLYITDLSWIVTWPIVVRLNTATFLQNGHFTGLTYRSLRPNLIQQRVVCECERIKWEILNEPMIKSFQTDSRQSLPSWINNDLLNLDMCLVMK